MVAATVYFLLSVTITVTISYWVIRLAVRHALEDEHRRRAADEVVPGG